MFASDSTHMLPTGAQDPSRTAALIRSKSSGCVSLIQAYCCADEQAKTSSGYSRASAVTLAKVRAHLRFVSRTGHSQALSMWAWPTALIRWALADAGRDSGSASSLRASTAPAATPARSSTSSARLSARMISCRRGCPAAAAT